MCMPHTCVYCEVGDEQPAAAAAVAEAAAVADDLQCPRSHVLSHQV